MSSFEQIKEHIYKRYQRYQQMSYDPPISQVEKYIESEDNFLNDLKDLVDDYEEGPIECGCDNCKDTKLVRDGAV